METLDLIREIGTPVVTSVVAWFLARRKYNSEVDKNLICNMQESLNFYKQIVDDNKIRLQEAESENKRLREQIKDMNDEMRQLREQVDYLTRFVCTNIACTNRKDKVKATKQADTQNKKDNK